MKQLRIKIKGKPAIGLKYNHNDFLEMKFIYIQWKNLNEALESLGSRSLNVPDLLSEGLFSYLFKVLRTNGSKNSNGYDAYNDKTHEGIQIKSCSINVDCTSFGPKTHWDKIYFMKFYPKSDDGLVEIFDISDIDFDNIVLNNSKKETFKDQQDAGRRPRLSIQKEIIDKYNIRPIKSIKLLKD